jgi:hypothetical protein
MQNFTAITWTNGGPDGAPNGYQSISGAAAFNTALAASSVVIADRFAALIDAHIGAMKRENGYAFNDTAHGGTAHPFTGNTTIINAVHDFANAQIKYVSNGTIQKVAEWQSLRLPSSGSGSFLRDLLNTSLVPKAGSNPGFVGIQTFHAINILAFELILAWRVVQNWYSANIVHDSQIDLHYFILSMWDARDAYVSWTAPGKYPAKGWFNTIAQMPAFGTQDDIPSYCPSTYTPYTREMIDGFFTSIVETVNMQGAEENY